MSSLSAQIQSRLARLFIFFFILIFAPAWSLRYWQGWVFLAVFFAGMLATMQYLLRHDVDLVRRRLKGATSATDKNQNLIRAGFILSLIALIVFSSIDCRAGWSHVPEATVLVADAIVALGLFVVFLAFRANSFAAAAVAVDEGQMVVSTGPYAMIRHPMYTGVLITFLAAPVALGSFWGLLFAIPLTAALVMRLSNEEKFLATNLAGYTQYRETVRYRLLPCIW